MKVRYSAAALADLGGIFDFLSERNPRAASNVANSVEKVIARIAEYPESAQETDAPGIRMTPAGRYPYLIFYVVQSGEVSIVRILHGARRRPWETRNEEGHET